MLAARESPRTSMVPVDQQRPAGVGVEVASPAEEIGSRQAVRPLVGEHQRSGLAKLAQTLQRRRAHGLADHGVVALVATTQLVFDLPRAPGSSSTARITGRGSVIEPGGAGPLAEALCPRLER